MTIRLKAVFSVLVLVGLISNFAPLSSAKAEAEKAAPEKVKAAVAPVKKPKKPKKVSTPKPEPEAAPVAKTRVCELESVSDSEYRVMFAEGEKSRYPDLKDLFDAMNAKGSTLFEDLQQDEELPDGQHSQQMELRVAKRPPIPFSLRSKPKVGRGDPACKDKTVTGYECRVLQLRDDSDTAGLPEGIHTTLSIKVSKKNVGFATKLTSQLGCDKTVLPSGAPLGFDEAPKGNPVKLIPSGSGKTKP